MESVTGLASLANQCGVTVKDYDYLKVLVKNENKLVIKVINDAFEHECILFESYDDATVRYYT